MASNHLIVTFRQHVLDWADRPAQRAKVGGQWHDTTWRELGEAMEAVAGGLVALGHRSGDKVGLCARNMAEWTQADLGILAARGVTVPLYPSNTAEQARFILQDASIRILFAGEQAEVDLGLALLAAGDLDQVIALDPSVDLRGEPRARSFQALLEEGRAPACAEEVRLRATQFRMDDLLTLVYTSGTTGEPKGVML
ncbi:MAG: AMP-binding protein, partial [Acidobacteria bacterium]|nr:AMP-binding protein [Acidobacteriota bacterium]